LLGVGVGVALGAGDLGAGDVGFVDVGAGLVADPPAERAPVVVRDVVAGGTCGTGAYAGAVVGVAAACEGFGDAVASGTATSPEAGSIVTCTGRF
jgi:O-acetyl-ADP-ribose deacetylase (regulator of RNase III)